MLPVIDWCRESAPVAQRNKAQVGQKRDRFVARWRVGPYIGLGEAAPLAGWGGDSLEHAQAVIAQLKPTEDWLRLDQLAAHLETVSSPSVKFALELAALDLAAQRDARSIVDVAEQWLGARFVPSPHAPAVLLTPSIAQTETIPKAQTFKIKLGRDLDRELELARRVRETYPQAILRFDANGTLGSNAATVLQQLAQLGGEFIEEPPLDIASPVPVALDESLSKLSDAQRTELYASGAVSVIVLKPMALGGIRRCYELAREAAAYGIASVVSHLWTGSIARRGEELLAGLVDSLVEQPRAHGLGWSPCDSRLSVVSAAADAPDAPAIIDEQGVLTWSALSSLVAEIALPPSSVRVAIEPKCDRDSIVRILAAIENGNPLVLLHPQSNPEQKQWRRERASVLPGEVPSNDLSVPDEAPLAFAFTSGTTGESKAVILSRRALIAAADASADRLNWEDDDRWLLSLPPAHVGGLSVVVRCLLARKPIVLAEPAHMKEAIEAHRATLVSIVPTILHRWLSEGWSAPPHLRIVLVGGAACSEDLRARAIAAGFPIATTYGLTETCGQVATRMPTETAPGVGRALRGVDVQIVDGRIHVGGPTLMDGYLGSPSLSGLFDTGDFGALSAGTLRVHGRRTDLIISGGENVYPALVEPMFDDDAFDSVCIFGVPDEEWGQRVAIAVTSDASTQDLREALQRTCERLARHERPRVFARFDSFPRTASGKVDRRALKRLAAERLRPV